MPSSAPTKAAPDRLHPAHLHPDGLPLPRRYWAILTIAIGLVMAVTDSSIANVALPTIARDLHASPAFAIWIVNGYQLAITISLLPLASLGEIFGYRRVYLAGLALFTLASLFCTLSDSLGGLAIARVVQGFGAAGILSVNSALVRFIYPHRILGRGIGINAFVVAISAALGPTLASAILAVGDWPALFAVNIPFGIVALIIGLRTLPHSPRMSHGFDWQSALASAATFGFAIGAIDSLGHGAAPHFYLAEAAIALVAGILLVRRQSGAAAPLLPLDLLRIPIFTLSVCSSITSFCAQMAAFVALPFYFTDNFGYSSVQIGLMITPWPIAIAIVAPLAGRLADRYPAGLLGGIGLVVFALGLGALATLPPDATTFDIAWRMFLSGAGFGLFQSPNNRTMVAAAPRERSGGASGMLGTARLLGQTTGAALVALLLARYEVEGTRYALMVAVGFAIAGALLSTLRLSPAGARGAAAVRVQEGQRTGNE
ncbi:MAG TPA: MFS transporter [Alphaproteobacteria bacterium]|nr:MFS transporter [Alphaproteobacteria bacterium]